MSYASIPTDFSALVAMTAGASPEEVNGLDESGSGSRRHRPAASGWFWSASVAVGVLVLVLAVAGVKSWADLRVSQSRATELRQRVNEKESSVQRLEKRIHLLRSNSELLERVAREELGVVRPDEIIVILPE